MVGTLSSNVVDTPLTPPWKIKFMMSWISYLDVEVAADWWKDVLASTAARHQYNCHSIQASASQTMKSLTVSRPTLLMKFSYLSATPACGSIILTVTGLQYPIQSIFICHLCANSCFFLQCTGSESPINGTCITQWKVICCWFLSEPFTESSKIR